ncbi:fumarylacetoacetate hydrolase family protein [Halohasta litorea]|uniref:Fumarylacetoacetate hydrolase family protein n=1 Tax=Halohasta litorea TaxID=869891 RepID=A0ABD6DCC1_9EURY
MRLGRCSSGSITDIIGIKIWTDIHEDRRQQAYEKIREFDLHNIVSYLSKSFTYRSRDIIAFGSPANPGYIEPGATVGTSYGNSHSPNHVVVPLYGVLYSLKRL